MDKNCDLPIHPIKPEDEIFMQKIGLTKREFFAALAMVATLRNQKNADDTPEAVAALAIIYANALLARLEKS